MKLKIFQVDAFSEKLFGGNPAAVCPLDNWLSDEKMQNIAAENNLAETAFYVRDGNNYHLRWFTPAVEVNLCGHATLATAHVLFNHLGYDDQEIRFKSMSGMLSVKKSNDLLTLNFPVDELHPVEIPEIIKKAVNVNPAEAYRGKNVLLIVLQSQADLEKLQPDISSIASAHPHGVIFTAKGTDVDFVSRCFFPNCGIHEDPVTGSAHCILVPYWASKLKKTELTARQLSKRRGNLWCRLSGDRVEISGKAITYMQGEIEA